LESAETLDELASSLAQHLKAKGLTPEYAGEIAQALMVEFATFEAPAPRPGSLSLLVGHYAIRKDDIKIFDALTDGLKAAAGVAFFTAHQPALGANVAIGVSLGRLIRALTMRGAWLDHDALHVLTILRCNASVPEDPGLSPAEVLAIVQRTNPDVDLAWVQHQLDFLKQVPTRDGAAAKLASEDAFGRWRSHA